MSTSGSTRRPSSGSDAVLGLGGHGPSLRVMATIEAKRFARHPLFILGALFTLVVTTLLQLNDHDHVPGDLLSWPVVPAFITGVTSIIVAARLTRSTEASEEAVGTAPGTEAQRTLALALACLVPFTVGLLWMVEALVIPAIWSPAPQEWWFSTTSDLQVICVLLAGGPVACLGGALLGVLTGRWLRFPGAPAVVALVVVIATMLGMAPSDTSHSVLRMWAPWVSFHSGTNADGTATLYAGSAFFYVLYQLCLCAAALLAAVWHDRAARSRRLVQTFAAVVVVGVACLGLAMNTGIPHNQVSDPVPSKVQH